MTGFPEQATASTHVSASPETVWALVADITRMGEWSPECVRAEWENGSTGPDVGSQFHGWNQIGTFEWDAACEVTVCEPGRRFEFVVPRGAPEATRWTFDFVGADGGTTLTESFNAPLINVDGSPANFEGRFEILSEAIATTIANIKAAAEA